MQERRQVTLIPIEKIHVLNPRNRDARKFAVIATSINDVGMKRPIVVSRRSEARDDGHYDLVCGQGRLESVVRMGCTEIPAIVLDISREERLIKSLVENLARRTPRMQEMARPIALLRDAGYTNAEIARKVGMDETSVGNVIRLYDGGEERLLQAVEAGRIPISVATLIASVDGQDAQSALTEAYETHGLRGKALLSAKKLVEKRSAFGKVSGRTSQRKGKQVTSESIVREVEQEGKRHRLLVRKAQVCDNRLRFIVSALRELMADENFRNLLRAEQMDTMPAYLAERMEAARP